MPFSIEAPPYLVQLFFKTKDGNGFSEDYYINAESYETALETATTAMTGLVDKRRALFTDSHFINYVRVSDMSKVRDTVIKSYTEEDGKGTYDPEEGDTEPDDDGLLIRLQATHAGVPFFNLKCLRLIPEECVTDGEFDPAPAYNTAFGEYRDALLADYMAVKGPAEDPHAETITDVLQLHMSQRKVGRPFAASRGRSRNP